MSEFDDLLDEAELVVEQLPPISVPPPLPPISEEEYVRQMLLLPPLVGSGGPDPFTPAERKAALAAARARQEAYARWRYRGFCAGEIFSL